MINQSTLRGYRPGHATYGREKIVADARRRGEQTAFLSHSHKDAALAESLQAFLQSQGWEVYIDWQDTEMPDKPTRDTARIIKNKIVSLDWFLYLATENSANSRWCPWEIGFADEKKDIDRIIIIPTKDSYGRHYGNEYLQLYRHIYITTDGSYAVFEPGTKQGTFIRSMRP